MKAKTYKEKKKKYWNKFNYKKWFKDNRGKFIDDTEKNSISYLLSEDKDKKYNFCLDVGIGNGRLLSSYYRKCKKIIGLDFAGKLIKGVEEEEKRLKIKVTTKVGDAENIPFDDNKFDLIINTRVLQHLPNWRKCIDEMARVGKNNSILILMVYNRLSFYGFKKFFLRFRDKFRHGDWNTVFNITRELTNRGFKVEKLIGTMPFQPELLGRDPTKKGIRSLWTLEPFAYRFPMKCFSGRMVIRATLKK